METSTIIKEDVDLNHLTSTNNPESAHIVGVPPSEKDEKPQAYVFRAMVNGFPVKALCGYTWVPHRDPKKLPICATCKAIYESDPKGHGDRDRLPDA